MSKVERFVVYLTVNVFVFFGIFFLAGTVCKYLSIEDQDTIQTIILYFLSIACSWYAYQVIQKTTKMIRYFLSDERE